MEKGQQPGLTLYLVGQRTFAGKLGKLEPEGRPEELEGESSVLDDAVEFVTVINSASGSAGVGVIPILLGTMFIDPELGVLVEMSKNSLYYIPYYQVVSGLKLA